MTPRISKTKRRPKPYKPRRIRNADLNVLQWNPRVASRTLDGNAFILLNSQWLRLNEVGTQIWEWFEHGSTLGHVVKKVVAEFDTTEAKATSDARHFISELIAHDVLMPVKSKSHHGKTP